MASPQMSAAGRGTNSERRRRPTVAAVLSILALLAVIACYVPTLAWLGRAWLGRIGYSHGILVPLVVAYLIYTARPIGAGLRSGGSPAGLALIVLSLMVVVFDASAESKALSALTIPLMAMGLVWSLAGGQALKRVIVPFIMLFSMCPPPSFLLVKLAARVQLLTASIGAKIANSIFGLQAVTEGVSIEMPQVYIQATSVHYGGFRTLMAVATFGAFFAYLIDGPSSKRFLVFATGIPMALFAAGLRVALEALVANYFGADTMLGFQRVSGYLTLAFAFFALLLVAKGFGCEGLKLSPRSS
jgi:exosortase